MAKKGMASSNRNILIILGTISILTALLASSCGSGGNSALNAADATASANLSPSTMAFTSKAVGTATSAQTVTVTNSGSADMNVSGIAMGGTNPGDFSQTNTCGSTIAAGANCAINIVFKPTASGTRTANVSLSDDASSSPQTVSLSGTLATTTANISPASVTLGSEPLGTASAVQAVTVSNTGTGSLSLTGVSVAGANANEFSQTNNCGSSLNPGSSCTVSVTFKPSAAGSATAGVMIADTAPNSPQTVTLSGTGMAPVASPRPPACRSETRASAPPARPKPSRSRTPALNR